MSSNGERKREREGKKHKINSIMVSVRAKIDFRRKETQTEKTLFGQLLKFIFEKLRRVRLCIVRAFNEWRASYARELTSNKETHTHTRTEKEIILMMMSIHK